MFQKFHLIVTRNVIYFFAYSSDLCQNSYKILISIIGGNFHGSIRSNIFEKDGSKALDESFEAATEKRSESKR